MRVWSPQQENIFEWGTNGRGSAIVQAVAGAGKTTTLIELITRIIGRVVVMAFNKAIAVEIQAKLDERGADKSRVEAGTVHSFGWSAWRKANPGCKIESGKIFNLNNSMNVPFEYRSFVMKSVGLARQWGIGLFTSFDDAKEWRNIVDRFDLAETLAERGESANAVDIEARIVDATSWAIRVLKESVKQAPSVVDFDDMLYMPLLRDVQMFQRDWVLIDEAQDTNPVRLALAKKMLRPGGRLVAVGDSRQAIYGFSGADSESLNKIAQEFNAIELPLTVTYRCPKSIVAHARQWVSHIEAHESAPEGSVTSIPEVDFLKLGAEELRVDDVILCRNTKPLVELAFAYIRRGMACHVEGRDIGQGLIVLAKKWKSAKTVKALRTRLQKYMAKEIETALAKGQETKAALVEDKVQTLLVIMDQLADSDSVEMVAAKINAIFSTTEDGQPAQSLTLSTIHKSKGREWDRVFWYGRNRFQPSPFARQTWQVEQEENLMYVAATRAKKELVEIEVPSKKKQQ